MKHLFPYLVAFTAGLKETARACNEARTAEELDGLIQQQMTKRKTKE